MEHVIAISGPPGAGSTTTARLLSEELGLKFFSPGRLFKDIATGRFNKQSYASLFREICTKRGINMPDFTGVDDSHGAINLWKTEFGKSPQLHEAIDELQIKLGERGGIVLDGKLSIHLIKNAKPKIWLKAFLDERAERAANRDDVSKDKAFEIVKKRQETERAEWKKIYGKDYWEQEKDADIVIDTTNLLPEQVVEQIISKMTNL
ncbi:MAG: (d)CMP kinase [Nanoarchaeota archaeon]